MKSRASWLVLTLFGLLALPTALVAQEAGWTFQGVGEIGGFAPTRSLGKNVAEAQQLTLQQATAELDPALMFGAGLEFIAPDDRLMIRAMFRQTVNQTATGSVIICDAFETKTSYCVPNIADAKLSMFSGEVVFLQGDPEKSFRHNFLIGAGLRSYQMVSEECVESLENPDVVIVCRLVEEIYQNQAAVQPFLDFGFGFTYEMGPVSVNARLIDTLGPYSGGAGSSTGDYQNDFLLTGGLALRVR